MRKDSILLIESIVFFYVNLLILSNRDKKVVCLVTYDVHIQCQASIYTFSLCRGHSWRMRLAKQETLTTPGHLVTPLVCRVCECPPWCSIVGATVTVHQFFCILLYFQLQIAFEKLSVCQVAFLSQIVMSFVLFCENLVEDIVYMAGICHLQYFLNIFVYCHRDKCCTLSKNFDIAIFELLL